MSTESGPRSFRLVLMGNGPFAVPAFNAIRERGQEITLVVARPSPVAVGNAKLPPTPVLDWARENRLNIFQPENINAPDAIQRIVSERADLLVVCDYGQILSNHSLEASRLGGINLHGSLLPRHRGAAPVQWSILSGDKKAGVSIIHMTPRLDGGPILAIRETELQNSETAEGLENRLSQLGVAPTMEAIDLLWKCQSLDDTVPLGKTQNQSMATKAPRLKKSDGQLDFRYPSTLIDRQIRGLQPWPGVYGNIVLDSGKTLRVILNAGRLVSESVTSIEHPPGMLIWGSRLMENQSIRLAVACQPGMLEIQSIQPSGKRPMTADEFLNGYGRNKALRFEMPTDPQPLLEQMHLFNPVSTPILD